MIQDMNQWFLSLQKGIETIKYWNYRPDKHDIQLANITGCLNAFTNLFSPLGFSSSSFSAELSSRLILDRKYDSKEAH